MIVISDTSPISNLLLIGRLSLLQKVFGTLLIPPVVDEEIRALTVFGKDISEYENANWITVRAVLNKQKLRILQQNLDDGEAEAILLALETNCNMLLIDERLGTKIAQQEGLQTIGLLGVLIKAKNEQIIPALQPILYELRHTAGFWLGEKLEQRILLDIGEI
jgi:uncharacterized protein